MQLEGQASIEAEASLRMLGPAAVLCALLQRVDGARTDPRSALVIDLYCRASHERHQRILAALDPTLREQVQAQGRSRDPVGPERVIALFTQGLAGMKSRDVLRRWGSEGGLNRLNSRMQDVFGDEAEAGPTLADGWTDQFPAEQLVDGGPALLAGLGAALSGVDADADTLARVLTGALPPAAPAGYSDDGRGTLRRDAAKVKRNDPCPCGSGKKFKRCCGG